MLRVMLTALVLSLPLSACVTVEPKTEQVAYTQVSGVVAFKEETLLPEGSSITVAVVDANSRGQVLMSKEFDIVRLPVPFFLATPTENVNAKAKYVVWAAVKVEGINQPLLITQAPFVEVVNNGVANALVEVKAAL